MAAWGTSGDVAVNLVMTHTTTTVATTLCTTGFPKFPPKENFYQPTMDPGSSIVLSHPYIHMSHSSIRWSAARRRVHEVAPPHATYKRTAEWRR